ncbi:MAG: hypothetical protein KBD78_04055 [Oligoflexales bacterium]|nr:hypothetical protein [Oligoflexales bacterium]
MNYEDFSQGMAYLEKAYGKSLESNQLNYWFDKFRSWTAKKFLSAVDDHINTNERFPSIASLLKRGYDFKEEVLTHKTDCKTCSGYGTLSTRSAEGYATTFRCPSCLNWAGKYSDEVPMYSSEFAKLGYKLDSFSDEQVEAGKRFLRELYSSKPDPEKERRRTESLRRDKLRDAPGEEPFG